MANKNFKVRHGLEVGDNFTVTASTGALSMGGDLTVTGNLTVNGTTTTINTDTLAVEDNEITLNANVSGSPTLDASVIVNRGTSSDVSIKWNETSDAWQFTNDGSTFYNLPTVDNNTTYTVSAQDGTSGKKIIRLTGSDASTDDVTLVEGAGITLSRAGDEITITNSGMGTTYSISAETATGGTNLRLTGSDASTDNVKFAEGTGITVTRTDADTITIATTVVDTNTTYTVSAQDGTAGKKIIRLTGSDASTDDVTLVAGTNVTLTRSTDEITIDATDTNTTYSISAETATGGTNLRLTGSDATTDNVKLAEGTGITVTRTDDSTITIATTVVDTNTTYSISAETATGGANLRLTDSAAGTDDVKIAGGTGVTVSRTDANTIDVAIGQAVATSDSPQFAAVNVDTVANIDTATLTTSATTANQVLDSFSTTTYRSARYHIQIASGSSYQIVEMVVLHDGTGAYQSTYADVASNSDLATFSVDINSGNCRVLTTPTNNVTVYKIVRTAVVV